MMKQPCLFLVPSFVYNIQLDRPEMLDKVATFNWPYNVNNPDAKSQNYWGGYGHSILSTAKHPEEAKLFLQFMHEYENEMKWMQETIDGYMPSRKAIAKSDEFWGTEKNKKLAPIIREAGSYAATNGVILGMEKGPNKWSPLVFARRTYAQLWTNLIAENWTPEKVTDWFQTEVQTIIESEQ